VGVDESAAGSVAPTTADAVVEVDDSMAGGVDESDAW
jgi:hypothetical protein